MLGPCEIAEVTFICCTTVNNFLFPHAGPTPHSLIWRGGGAAIERGNHQLVQQAPSIQPILSYQYGICPHTKLFCFVSEELKSSVIQSHNVMCEVL